MSERLVLAGDIGGTKSNLGLFRGTADAPVAVVEQTYFNREFGGLAEVGRRFLDEAGLAADSACFGVAGTVVGGTSVLPNLGWTLSEAGLAQALGMESVSLVNDLEATALGLATLAPAQLHTLNPGRPRPGGNRALIAAGTGLGMAIIVSKGGQDWVLASEGGHMDFAPNGEIQAALLGYLAARHGHVSVERVVSGPGLANVYDFLQASGETVPDWLTRRFESMPDRSAVIAQAGLVGKATICVKTLELFLSAYGAAAGNLALLALATGGVYVGGGIAPRLIEALPTSGFMPAFIDKGRFADLLTEVPVHIVMEPKTALRGAASHALRALEAQ